MQKLLLLLPVFLLFSYQLTKPKAIEENSLIAFKKKTRVYYHSINFLNKTTLYSQLSSLVTKTHTTELDYTPDTWQALKKTDSDPKNPNKLLLIYGSDDTDKDFINDISRDKNKGGNGIGKWNREHVYPRSLGRPNLGYIGPGADVHMLRPSDMKQNSKRSNLPFEDAKGVARKINKSWYPGDRWRGDVARIIMYMYLRYNNRAEPNRVAKSANTYNKSMPNVFLKWNVQDPVDLFEINRNETVYRIQGNRNPFIDNAYIAYLLWGGPKPTNNWQLR